MKTFKKISLLFVLLLSITMVMPCGLSAKETKVKKATISADVKDDTITLTIKKTENAEGYEIYVKSPGDKKYQKVETLSQDGSKERSYSYSTQKSGNYLLKVRGFKKANGKTVYGNYSKSVKVKVSDKDNKSEKAETKKKSKSTERTVYITENGKCYHYNSKCGNGKYMPIDLEVAKKSYSPCKKCVK